MTLSGLGSAHDTDRALRELLEEIRIAQMGAQIMLGFLLAIAYTSTMQGADTADRVLWAWAVGVTSSAFVLLLGPVVLHRLNFGLRGRPRILRVGHMLTMLGLTALAAGVVLSVWLAARIAVPEAASPLLVWSSALVALTWLALPAVLRRRRRSVPGPDDRIPPEPGP